MDDFDVLIVGGGLAGLTAAIHLKIKNYKVAVFEPRHYPHHKVCGEYISNEVLPYMEFLGVSLPQTVQLNEMLFSTVNGKTLKAQMPLGGFGLSRFTFDNILYKTAIAVGVLVIPENVTSVDFENDAFKVLTESGMEFTSKFGMEKNGFKVMVSSINLEKL